MGHSTSRDQSRMTTAVVLTSRRDHLSHALHVRFFRRMIVKTFVFSVLVAWIGAWVWRRRHVSRTGYTPSHHLFKVWNIREVIADTWEIENFAVFPTGLCKAESRRGRATPVRFRQPQWIIPTTWICEDVGWKRDVVQCRTDARVDNLPLTLILGLTEPSHARRLWRCS